MLTHSPAHSIFTAPTPYKKSLSGLRNCQTGVHRHVNIIYSNEALKRVFAYVEAPDAIRLEPGQTKTTMTWTPYFETAFRMILHRL